MRGSACPSRSMCCTHSGERGSPTGAGCFHGNCWMRRILARCICLPHFQRSQQRPTSHCGLARDFEPKWCMPRGWPRRRPEGRAIGGFVRVPASRSFFRLRGRDTLPRIQQKNCKQIRALILPDFCQVNEIQSFNERRCARDACLTCILDLPWEICYMTSGDRARLTALVFHEKNL